MFKQYMNEKEIAAMTAFIEYAKQETIKLQKQEFKDGLLPTIPQSLLESCWEANEPYLGAIGGGLTYCFTPTGIGVVIEVIWCKGTKYELRKNITDYDCW